MRRLIPYILAILLALPSTVPAQGSGFYHTVEANETVASVARRYGISASELAAANRMSSDARLAGGSRLWVPRRGAAQPSSSTAAPVRTPSPSGTVRQPSATPPQTTTSGGAARTPSAVIPSQPSAAARRPAVTAPARTPSATSSSPSSNPSSTVRLPSGTASRPVPAPSTSAPRAVPASGDFYTVQPGDSLWRVANRHGITVSELAAMNGLSPGAQLEVGQALRVRGGGSFTSIEDVPGGGVSNRPTTTTPTTPSTSVARPSAQGFIWPVEGRLLRRFTNRRDEKYTGIDIAVPKGTEVRAARDGKVVYASDSIPAYGRMVIVQHSGDLATCYAHLDRLLVVEGQNVKRGQVIARSGDTGRGSSPFLHFEVRRGGNAVDPEPFLP